QRQVMEVIRSLIFLLSFQLLPVAKGSMVRLNENGYEDLVVAINPHVPEDPNIILNIMNMIKNASTYLFEMTKHRFFFKSVKIIIPKTWKKTTTYSRLKTESYDKADVIIADHYMKHVNDPYTLQYRECKEKGRYIHFTPKFLLDDNLTKVYGEKGRVFVHEWAHLRWGVFDEYSNDVPFYVSRSSKKASVEVTSCPAGVTGRPIFVEYSGDKYESRLCRYDGQLYEKGCVFIPDIQQNISCSVMWMLNIPSIEFCDKNTHNSEAPNMQNKICNSKSTWEVIMESDDFRNSAVVNASAPPSETTFTLLQTQDRVVALVLDVSASMSKSDRIGHLHSAAEDFLLRIIEIGSWAGIVTFDSDASEKAPLQQITNDAARQKLVLCLPTVARGKTNICAGIRKGLKLIADKMTTTYGSEIVLLTDGEDRHMAACLDLVKQTGAKIHTIALGPDAAKELEEFSKLTGGLMLSATDGATPSKLARMFGVITSGSGDISEQSIQLENKELVVQRSGWMNATVPVDRTVGNDTFFSISWSQSQPFFFLRDPKGKEYGSSDFTINNSNQKTARLSISGTAEVGDWQFCIKNVHTATQGISVTVTSRPASSDVPPVRTAVHMSRANKAFNPVVVYAEVSQGFLPILGATVIATIETDGAAAVTLELLDNGAGADTIKDDGIYSRYFTSLQGTGRYSVKVHAHGRNITTRLGSRQNRALYLPGHRENGNIYINAPRPKFTDKEIQAKLGSFSRISASSLVVNTREDSAPVYPPCKITDLHARIENNTIVLSWTAPGGDFDNGKADHYIIKSSENLLDLRNHFDRATSVNCSNLIPKEAGREESFKIKPDNFVIEIDTIIYFAIRAVDHTKLISEVSNIAQVTWFIPKASVPLNYDSSNDSANSTVTAVPLNYDGNNDSANSTVTVSIAALCVAVVCTIVISTLYVLQKQKGRLDIETMQ
ncbi:CLCA1 regulator, partial [Dromas ardeola]|nr:CLCA1 regulator [Dromas ardeola]